MPVVSVRSTLLASMNSVKKTVSHQNPNIFDILLLSAVRLA